SHVITPGKGSLNKHKPVIIAATSSLFAIASLPETLKLLQTLGAPRLVSGRGEQDISARGSLNEIEWLNE
ncbi:MAG: hypothetical protein ABL921_17835, partial [Pirellula sp.]